MQTTKWKVLCALMSPLIFCRTGKIHAVTFRHGAYPGSEVQRKVGQWAADTESKRKTDRMDETAKLLSLTVTHLEANRRLKKEQPSVPLKEAFTNTASELF